MKNPNRTARETRRAETGDSTDTIVVCSGKHGTALQYAKWLMQMLDCDGMEYSRKNFGYVSMYKNVVYIGSIRNGDIHMLNMLWQNYNNFDLGGRNLFICGVGIGDPESRTYFELLRRRNGCEGQSNIHFFILPGRIRKERLNLLDRSLLRDFASGGAYGLYDKEDADLIMQRALSNYDGVSWDAIEPIVTKIRELN